MRHQCPGEEPHTRNLPRSPGGVNEPGPSGRCLDRFELRQHPGDER
jgi:hypothetical protein